MLLFSWLTALSSRIRHRTRRVVPRTKFNGLRSHRGFPTAIERLEERSLLSIDTLSVDQVAAIFRQSSITVTGATIVTHGFQTENNDGDSLMPLATAIRDRVDSANGLSETAWFLDYDISGAGGVGAFDALKSSFPATGATATGEVVLLWDWAPESQEPSSGWAEAAGDALFSMLVGLGIVDPAIGAANTMPLHFIAHSFGSGVTSEAIERLAAFGIPVDQVTYLDPHDFAQNLVPVDDQQKIFDLGLPDGYGATVWNKVAFADVYYQTEGGLLGTAIVPEGRPIPGAYNLLVNDDPDVGTGITGEFGSHSDVWEKFYTKTIEQIGSTTGYAFSRIARHAAGTDAINRPSRNFFGPGQDHEHTPLPLPAREGLVILQ